MTGIYFIDENDELTPMAEAPYESEGVFQAMLARHPELLAGDQIDSGSPRRWLLIGREQPVPAEEAGGARWALDHLFIDQGGVPTLVEVKRSSDTRLRRSGHGSRRGVLPSVATPTTPCAASWAWPMLTSFGQP